MTDAPYFIDYDIDGSIVRLRTRGEAEALLVFLQDKLTEITNVEEGIEEDWPRVITREEYEL